MDGNGDGNGKNICEKYSTHLAKGLFPSLITQKDEDIHENHIQGYKNDFLPLKRSTARSNKNI